MYKKKDVIYMKTQHINTTGGLWSVTLIDHTARLIEEKIVPCPPTHLPTPTNTHTHKVREKTKDTLKIEQCKKKAEPG